MSKTEQTAKTKLLEISQKIDAVVGNVLSDMTYQEIQFVLDNYEKYLSYDLKRNFNEAREKNLKESPFDSIINNDLDIK